MVSSIITPLSSGYVVLVCMYLGFFFGMYFVLLAHQLCTTGKAGLDTTLLAGTGFSSFFPSFIPSFVCWTVCFCWWWYCSRDFFLLFHSVFLFRFCFCTLVIIWNPKVFFCQKKVDEIWLAAVLVGNRFCSPAACRNSSCILQHSSRELAEWQQEKWVRVA